MKQTTKTEYYMHPKYSDYGVDYFGNVYSFKYNKERRMNTVTINSGYERLQLHQGDNPFYLVSRFALECFLGKLIPKDLTCDHKNRDKSDNRKCNLRLATQAEQKYNKKKEKNRTSIYKGVSWSNSNNKWRVYIRVDGKGITGGSYSDEKEAAKVYNRLALHYCPDFCILNEV
jgi:hypothetical protein